MPRAQAILLISRDLGIGGTARDVSNIARALDRSRFEPHVACFDSEGIRSEELRSAGIPIITVPIRSFRRLTTVSHGRKLGDYIRRRHIGLIHSFDVPANILGVALARLLNIRVIVSALWHRQLISPLYRTLLRMTDVAADAIVVNSNAIRDHLVTDEKVRPALIHLCYGGVDTQRFVPDKSRRPSCIPTQPLVIGTLCVLRPEKRLDLLLEAFSLIRHLVPTMKLLIVGSGQLLPVLKRHQGRLGLEQECVFEPACEDVTQRMRSIDIFVVPSSSESIPNALIEAMACGCCVVASRVGGIS